MKQRDYRFYSYIILAILAIIVIGLAVHSHNKTNGAAAGAAQTSNLPQKTVYMVVKSGKVITGPDNLVIAPNQKVKMTVHGEGYGEGDNLIIKGFSSAFFELDELDTPTTQYFQISKPGTYPLIVDTTDQHVGNIIVK
jgi:hypothetical protein